MGSTDKVINAEPGYAMCVIFDIAGFVFQSDSGMVVLLHGEPCNVVGKQYDFIKS